MMRGGWYEVLPGRRLRPRNVVAAGDVIEDALNDDDSDVNVAGDVGEKLIDEAVDGIEGVTGEDAGEGGGGVGVDAGDVEIGEFGPNGIVQQGGVVGHGFAAVAPRDDGAGDGIDEALGERGVGHAKVARVLMCEDWNGEGAEELTGRVLQVADAHALAEAFETWTVGGVRVGPDGDGGDAEDGGEIDGVGEVMKREVALLLP